VLLSERAPAWVDEAKRRYAVVAADAAGRAREQQERADGERRAREEAERQRRQAEAQTAVAQRAREEAERQQREAEARIAVARDAQAAAERQLEDQRLREQAERARSRSVTGSRDEIVASVQKELVEMLRAKPSATEIRVRILIEDIESGKP
jgi:hypothetical protein